MNNYIKLAVYRDVDQCARVISITFPFSDKNDASKAEALSKYVATRSRLVSQPGCTCRGSVYRKTDGLAFDVIGEVRKFNGHTLS